MKVITVRVLLTWYARDRVVQDGGTMKDRGRPRRLSSCSAANLAGSHFSSPRTCAAAKLLQVRAVGRPPVQATLTEAQLG